MEGKLPTSSVSTIYGEENATPKKNQARRWPWFKKEKNYFDGKRHFREGYHYRRPTHRDLVRAYGSDAPEDDTKYMHRDVFGRLTYAKKNTLTYISPTESRPKPLMVQTTSEAMQTQPQGDWRRVKMAGKVPSVLRLSEWALRPHNWLLKSGRVVIVVVPVLCLLSLPLEKAWDASDFDDSFTEFPNYCWAYPKHAKNRMDQRPSSAASALQAEQHQSISAKVRLLRPRMLVVYMDGEWILDASPRRHQKYIFISYTNIHFPTRHRDARRAEEEKAKLEEIAQERTLQAGLQAYWIDTRCCAPEDEPDLHSTDVHRMCDVIRGSEEVYVVLPKINLTNKRQWGSRMWTLPEALLAQKDHIVFTSSRKIESLSKLDMTDEVWDDGDGDGDVIHEDHQPSRLLAEHFSGTLTLGRLELFAIALAALSARSQSGDFSRGDIAYALMGLLHYRIPLDKSDSLFQALARLSLANDSDRLIERMVCMLPSRSSPVAFLGAQHNTFLELTDRDEFGSQLWDIEPLCQVAGVGREDQEVILDSCRGVSIRWKSFPQMKYKRSIGFWKLVAEIVLRSGAYWVILGLGLLIKYVWSYIDDQDDFLKKGKIDEFENSNEFATDVSLIFLGTLAIIFALLLTLAAPSAVRKLYGGRVMQSQPWLVGFEGTLPVAKLEQMIFGNAEGRLTYEPSSTPYSQGEEEERIGVEPAWIADPTKHPRPELPRGHRLFTLVDTGSLTISVFSAVRPPSVAVIAGREGGMLRAVLCHYERSNNCLYKETVIRMDSVTLNQAKTLSWIKLNFGNNYDR